MVARNLRAALGAVLAIALVECRAAQPAPEVPTTGEDNYDVRILRDSWGVPHIYGKTDADVAYGLAYAHCEDDFATIQDSLLAMRADLAAVRGPDAVPIDYFVKLFRFREIVAEKYETDLSPETRAICRAYADGCNLYASLHPDEVVAGALPFEAHDVVTGFVAKTPMFFGLDDKVRRLFESQRPPSMSARAVDVTPDLPAGERPMGSNTFSIAPRRTPDGKTHLAINSHQPWTGPLAYYEVRLKSQEGWDAVGAVFPGSPVILLGHNRYLGWAHTVNQPDLVDVYALEINPDNPNQYRFDGQWRDLEVSEATLWVKALGPFALPASRELLYSVHGPVIRRPHGAYAVRYAGYGDIRQVEQWYRMNKARNIDEFERALRIRAIPCFNVGYADCEGNVWYVYNARLPVRLEGHDWQKCLPGNTSETLWTEYLPFDKLPQVRNPASGFVQSCNSTPFRTTIGPENPKPEDFSPTLGIEPPDRMTNRSLRLLELLEADPSITEDEFYAYKYDTKYSPASTVGAQLKALLATSPPQDSLIRKAYSVLRTWDLATDPDNRAAALGVLAIEPLVRGRGGDPMEALQEATRRLQASFGRVDPPWNQVNRLVRGDLDVGLGGGPDVLHAVYGRWQHGRLVGRAGDCYVLMVTWDADGNVHSRSIHQFGSATLDRTSPHYADQVPLFVARKTKPVWLDEDDLRAHLEGEYRPGEPRPPARAGVGGT
jgi:penicillin amidase/acyl-homoserine-lactone acylase